MSSTIGWLGLYLMGVVLFLLGFIFRGVLETGNRGSADDELDEHARVEHANPTAFEFDLVQHLFRQRSWSMAAFGPWPRVFMLTNDIRKELLEIECAPTDVDKWIDVVLLALDGAWRAGHTPAQITQALARKQARNEARERPNWRMAAHDKAIEHVREAAR